MSFCNKKIEVSVPSGWDYKMITVRCGNTSPHGTPFMCDDCAEKNQGRDWRREAELDGEQWDDDY